MDQSAAWDAIPRIVSDPSIIGVGNAVGNFLVGTMGIAGPVLYLLVAMPTFVYGMFYVAIGTGMVAEVAAERTFEAAKLMIEVNDGDDGDEGRDSGDDKRDNTESLAYD